MTRPVTAVVPVKEWAHAKRRLDLSSHIRGDLARAFAEDVIGALTDARLVGRVVVVSSEPGILDVVRRCGALLVADPSGVTVDRLNASISAGVQCAAESHPHAPVVVVPADLPSLTSDSIDAALRVAGDGLSMLSDTTGEGTTLLLAPTPRLLDPHYGRGSAARHAAAGHREMVHADPRLRRDVDSWDDLAEAVALGVGPATRAVLLRHPLDLAG